MVNHGMSSSYLDKLRNVPRNSLHFHQTRNGKYSRPNGSLEGYGGDPAPSLDRPLDWCDFFHLTVFPEGQRIPNLWPESPSDFRETVIDYATKLWEIHENLLITMARLLKIEDDSFLKHYAAATVMRAQFNLYPPYQKPNKTLGIKPHSDGSTFTLVLQDIQVEGLQVLKDGQWFRVPIIPHALFISVGDQLEIMSNGIFKSPIHRVMTNSEKERISLPFLCKIQTEVEPVEELLSHERPRLYKKVNYSYDFYFKCFQQGILPIDAAKI